MPEAPPRSIDDLPSEWAVQRCTHLIRLHMPELRARYHIKTIALFGSYVRNEQHPDSDLDVLVTLERPLTPFEQVDLRDDLAGWLGVPVDVVIADRLLPGIARYILREALPL